MTVMERIEKMQEESLRILQSLETTVKDNTQTIKSVTDSLEFLGKQVEDVTLHVDSLQSQVETLEKENAVLHDKCINLEAYQRRWNLRVAGIPKRAREDIKKTIIDILGLVSPDIAQHLHSLWTSSTGLDPALRTVTPAAASLCSSCLAPTGTGSGEMREPLSCSRRGKSKSSRI